MDIFRNIGKAMKVKRVSKIWVRMTTILLIFIYSNSKYIRTHTKEKPLKFLTLHLPFCLFILNVHPEYFGIYCSWWNHQMHFKMVHFNIKTQNLELVNLKCVTDITVQKFEYKEHCYIQQEPRENFGNLWMFKLFWPLPLGVYNFFLTLPLPFWEFKTFLTFLFLGLQNFFDQHQIFQPHHRCIYERSLTKKKEKEKEKKRKEKKKKKTERKKTLKI